MMGAYPFCVEYIGVHLPFLVEFNERNVKSWKSVKNNAILSWKSVRKCLILSWKSVRKCLILPWKSVNGKDKVVYMPIYMLMFLEKEQVIDVTYRLDLSDLTI